MPKALKEFPKVERAGRKPKHPYDAWFKAASTENGCELVGKDDYPGTTGRTIRHNLYRVAKKEGITIETRTIKDGDDEVGLALRVVTVEEEKKSK